MQGALAKHYLITNHADMHLSFQHFGNTHTEKFSGQSKLLRVPTRSTVTAVAKL